MFISRREFVIVLCSLWFCVPVLKVVNVIVVDSTTITDVYTIAMSQSLIVMTDYDRTVNESLAIVYIRTVDSSLASDKPNTHRRRRRDETVESRRVGVGDMYMNSRRLPTDSAM